LLESWQSCLSESDSVSRPGFDQHHQEIIKKIILAFGPYNRPMRPREASRGLTWVI
jgi:hypothetical protein